jgi:hypothetical protein
VSSAATRLVEVAEELYEFGSISERRGHTGSNPGDDSHSADRRPWSHDQEGSILARCPTI